jgi:hypothetical protein
LLSKGVSDRGENLGKRRLATTRVEGTKKGDAQKIGERLRSSQGERAKGKNKR